MGRVALVDWVESEPQAADGTRFWRPDVPAGIGAWAAFDLRGLGLPGAFVYTRDRDTALPAKGSRFDIGALFTDPLSQQRANQVGNYLGRTIAAGTLPIDLIGELAGDRLRTVDTGGGRLRRVFRMFDLRFEFAPIVRGGATDTFTRADGGLGANWTTLQAALAISGNTVVVSSNPGSMHYAGTFDPDQYSQCAATTTVSGFYMVSALVRASPANGAEFYFARVCGSCGDVAVGKRVGFSQSEFASGGSLGTGVPATRTLRLEVDGSGLEAFIGGSSVVTTTDTDLTAGNPGIHIATANATDASIDDFDGGDLSTPILQSLSGGITPTGALTRVATLYPIIVNSADTAATAGPVTVTMPASIVAGRLLIAMIATDAGVTATPGGGQGWTSITDTAQSTNVRLVILAKIAAGSDALTLTLGTSQDCAVHVMQIDRHGVTSVATDIAKGTAVAQGTANTSPDPPSVTPAAAVANLIIACNASDDDDNTATYWPTNYTAQAQVESAQSTSSCMMQVAVRRLATGAAENPGVFTLAAAEEWVAQTLCVPPAPQGTLFTQSQGGGLTPSGTVARQTGKKALATVTPTGALVRAAAKIAAGTITPSGLPRKLTVKAPFVGGLTPSGSMVKLRTVTLALAGALTPSAVIARLTGKKAVGALTPTGIQTRAASKQIAAAIVPAGTVGKFTVKAPFVGVLLPAGALVRAVGKVFTGNVTPAGALARARTVARTFTAAILPAGALTRSTVKAFSSSVLPTGSLSQTSGKGLVGSIVPTAAIYRATAKAVGGAVAAAGVVQKATIKAPFAGSITPAAVVSVLRVLLRSMAGAITPSGVLSRTAGKGLVGTLNPSSTLTRAASKRVTGTLNPSSTLLVTRAVFLTLSGSITPTGTIGRAVARSRTLLGSLAPTGTLARSTLSGRSGQIQPSGAVTRTVGKGIGGELTPVGTIARYTARAFAGSITPAGSLAKLFDRTLTGSIALTGTMTKTLGALGTLWSIVAAGIRDRTAAGPADRTTIGPPRRRVSTSSPRHPGES